MQVQRLVIVAIVIAAASLGLQVASNSKLQFDIKDLNSKIAEQEYVIRHNATDTTADLQISNLKSKTTEQDQLIQSLTNELNSNKQIMEKSNMEINQLQSNVTSMYDEIKSLSDRVASLEHKIQQQSNPILTNTSNSIIAQNKTNTTSQPLLLMNSTIFMTKPEIKILSVIMSPNPLKIGDVPTFAVSYQNISNKTLLQNLVGCGATPSLHWEIFPSSNVQEQFTDNNGSGCVPKVKNIQPNETYTASGYGIGNGSYGIAKTGKLNVTLIMHLEDGSMTGIQTTIQFNVNATQ